MNYSIIKLSVDEIKPTNYSTGKWVEYGSDNLFPNKLMRLYSTSPTHQAIIDYKAQLICGEGFILDTDEKKRINDRFNINDLLQKVALDFAIFNGISLLIGWQRDLKEISKIYHSDFSEYRADYKKESSIVDGYWHSEDWENCGNTNYKPILFPSFNPKNPQAKKTEVAYYKTYSPQMRYYPKPSYCGGIEYIDLEAALAVFHLSCVKNGFTPPAIISHPDDPMPEEKINFENELKSNHVGPENGNNLIIIWGQSGEKKIEITPMSVINNENLYRELNDISQQKIITAHRLTSPTLVGLPGAGSLGGNANEIEMATDYFYSQTIRSSQRTIERYFNKILRYAGLTEDLTIENFKVFPSKINNTQTVE